MGINIINEAGGQWHGNKIYIEALSSTATTSLQERITCIMLEKYYEKDDHPANILTNENEFIKWLVSNDTVQGWTEETIEKGKKITKTQIIVDPINDVTIRLNERKDYGDNASEVSVILNKPAWRKSFLAQLNSWIIWSSNNNWSSKNYVFVHHDSEKKTQNGEGRIALITEDITKALNEVEGLQGKYPTKDNFNKADIYAVEKNFIPQMPNKDDIISISKCLEYYTNGYRNKKFIGISLKQLPTVQVYAHVVSLFPHKLQVYPENFEIHGLKECFNIAISLSNSIKGGRSSALTFTMDDEVGENDFIKRHMILNIRSNDWSKGGFAVEMGQGNAIKVDNEGNLQTVIVPSAQIAKCKIFLDTFLNKKEDNDLNKLWEEFSKSNLNNFISDKITLTPSFDKPADVSDKDYLLWVNFCRRILQAYVAINRAVEIIIKNSDEKDYNKNLSIFLGDLYLEAKGISNSYVQHAPYLYLGN